MNMTLFRLKTSSYPLNYFAQGMAAATPCHMGSSATVTKLYQDWTKFLHFLKRKIANKSREEWGQEPAWHEPRRRRCDLPGNDGEPGGSGSDDLLAVRPVREAPARVGA